MLCAIARVRVLPPSAAYSSGRFVYQKKRLLPRAGLIAGGGPEAREMLASAVSPGAPVQTFKTTTAAPGDERDPLGHHVRRLPAAPRLRGWGLAP
jgi:hypothetical protein